jgi:uncharacterized protein (DUF1697 family)
MDHLKELFAGLGLTGVTTYLQSGNVVFESTARGVQRLSRSIESQIALELGMEVAVMLRSGRELEAVKASNPLARRTKDATQLHVTFLATEADPSNVAKLRERSRGADEFVVTGREIFLLCPDGYGRTRLNNTFFEERLGVRATTRNWRTVLKLVEMTAR